jgi:peptidoglycan/xylan/chitin deacetylase (PgdA/CDA1 family)
MAVSKKLAGAVFRHTGLPLVRFRNRKALRILMYHRFAGREREFAAQCDHLMEHYRPVSLTEACRMLRDDAVAENAVVITVDDGYRDFYTSAFPILQERRIPAIIFLVTDFLDRRLWIWTEQVNYAVERSVRSEVEIAGLRLTMGSLKQALKEMPDRDRRAAMEALPDALGVEIPEAAPSGSEPLEWEQVREMARAGMEFGAHTRSHPILSRVTSKVELSSEIAGSRARIEQELQRHVIHFCYPNGQACDVNASVIEATRKAGYESAVSTIWGLNRPGADRFELRRLGVDPGVSRDWFERVVAGFL